jgi:hypothetical protein
MAAGCTLACLHSTIIAEQPQNATGADELGTYLDALSDKGVRNHVWSFDAFWRVGASRRPNHTFFSTTSTLSSPPASPRNAR